MISVSRSKLSPLRPEGTQATQNKSSDTGTDGDGNGGALTNHQRSCRRIPIHATQASKKVIRCRASSHVAALQNSSERPLYRDGARAITELKTISASRNMAEPENIEAQQQLKDRTISFFFRTALEVRAVQ